MTELDRMQKNLDEVKKIADEYGFKLNPELGRFLEADERLLRPVLCERYGIPPREYAKRYRGIRIAKIDAVNGYVATPDRWMSFTIHLNHGLLMFLHKICKLFTSAARVVDSSGEEDTKIPWERTVEVARKLLDAFWSNTIMDVYGFGLADLSRKQLRATSAMLTYMERFAVGHELGHVCAHITTDPIPEAVAGGVLAKMFAGHLDDIHVADWTEEFTADLVGVRLVLKSCTDDEERTLAYGAVEGFFVLLNLLEGYYEKKYGRALELGTHPPARLRLQALRRVKISCDDKASSDDKTSPELGDAFAAFARRVLNEA